METDALIYAQQIVRNNFIKNSMKSIMQNFQGDLQDVIIIFITPDNYADAYWTNLSRGDILKILRTIHKSLDA